MAVGAISCGENFLRLLNEWVRAHGHLYARVCVCVWQSKLCKQVTMSKLNLEQTQRKVRQKDKASGWERRTDHDKLARIFQNAGPNAPLQAKPASLELSAC